MEELNILKAKRKEKQVSLEQISKDIKIPVYKLKALEEGDFSIFPGIFYAKSFLKTYADYLGVGLKEIELPSDDSNDEEVKEEYVPVPQKKKVVISRKTYVNNRINIKNLTLLLTGFTVTMLILIFAVDYIPMDCIVKLFNTAEIKSCTRDDTAAPIPVKTYIMVKGVTNQITWLRVTTDDNEPVEYTLAENISKEWTAERSLKMRVGYVKGINIFYRKSNDEEYKAIDIIEGSRGEVNEIEFINDPGE